MGCQGRGEFMPLQHLGSVWGAELPTWSLILWESSGFALSKMWASASCSKIKFQQGFPNLNNLGVGISILFADK